MIKTLSIVVLLMNMSPVLLASETNLIYFGGGGEPKDALTTQFDETARGLGEFYKANKNYSTTVSFNGGHPVTEGIIKDKFKGAKIEERFTVSSYKSVIQETIEKLSKNPPEIPEGGKILIFIDSHGGEKSGKTHSISTTAAALTNMNNVSDGTSASLDALEELTKLAEAKNVKLAIVDGSCHAGNSLPLANSKTCVISASGPKHYAYSTFTNAFVTQMKKGKNLEDVFLETREQLNGLGFPMISTPEGMSVQDEIYPALTPYMYYHDEYRGMALDKIDDYFRENNSDEQVCRREKEYDSLKAVLSLIEDINMVEKKSFFSSKVKMQKTVDLDGLRKKLDEYKKTQDDYIKKLRELSSTDLDKVETIKTDFYTTGTKYTYREILSTDYGKLIEGKDRDLARSGLPDSKRENLQRLKEFYQTAQQTKERLLRENPQFVKQQQLFDQLKSDEKVSFQVASGISHEAHTAYNAYYKYKQKQLKGLENPAPNPCRDFVL